MKFYQKNCDVCNNVIKIDAWGNGTCKKCGWNNDKYSSSYPNAINPPNFISLNQAKRYFKLGKSFLPTYPQFLNLVKRGFDFTFKFEGKKYQLSVHDDYTLWEIDTKNFVSYKTFAEFKSNFSIDGVAIKDNWDKIKSLQYDC